MPMSNQFQRFKELDCAHSVALGPIQIRELSRKGKVAKNLESWSDFRTVAERFDRQRIASESGLAFLFTEGALVDAIRTGKW